MNAARAFKTKHITILAAAMTTSALAGTLTAATPAALSPQAAITARQAGFKKMGAAMKALNEQIKSDTPAKDVMAVAARTIAVTAREQPGLFPAGSGSSAGIPTDALPNVWSDRATFNAQMNQLLAESGKLMSVAAGGDAAAIKVQAKATGAVCGACHRQFRVNN